MHGFTGSLHGFIDVLHGFTGLLSGFFFTHDDVKQRIDDFARPRKTDILYSLHASRSEVLIYACIVSVS